MSLVWEFRDGGMRPWKGTREQTDELRKKILVHVPSDEVITSNEALEERLAELGWERYTISENLLQFHKPDSIDLISVPRDFSKMKSVHMYDIVVKTRYVFLVKDA